MSIEVKNISKTFGEHFALQHVSLLVPSGELVVLLGPSGSGKTTLLRIIAGLERADQGSGPIFFHREDVARRGVGDRRVGFVFQHYALFRHMSVFENVAFGMRVRPRRDRPSEEAIREKVRQLLHLVQLDGLAERFPNQLSGGQRQRVALARALAVEPRVLLLDEPFGALDAKVRQELRRWLRRLHDELDVTTLFVTHDQYEALEVADRVVVMNHGEVEQVGTPDEVFHRPQTEFVMNFLGQTNRFGGKVKAGRVSFCGLDLELSDAAEASSGPAKVYIRPHDLLIEPRRTHLPGFPARVERIDSAGPVARLELSAASGETVHAEIPQEQFRGLGLRAGDGVYVTPRKFKVFSEPSSPMAKVGVHGG